MRIHLSVGANKKAVSVSTRLSVQRGAVSTMCAHQTSIARGVSPMETLALSARNARLLAVRITRVRLVMFARGPQSALVALSRPTANMTSAVPMGLVCPR